MNYLIFIIFNMAAPPLSSCDFFLQQRETPPNVASLLKQYISKADINIICDDSSSMRTLLTASKITRWQELKKRVAKIIEYAVAINDFGVNLYFMNRGTVYDVKSMSGLSEIFSKDPEGATPLCGTLGKIYAEKKVLRPGATDLLILCLTDGEPSDGSREEVQYVLRRKADNVHISCVEVSDVEANSEWLDELCKVPVWDGYDRDRYYEEARNVIKNFSNTDFFETEVEKVKRVQGANFKFNDDSYTEKILLATYVKEYNTLDQISQKTSTPTVEVQDGCCIVL